MLTNTRDLGLNHGPGKGDADRTTNVKAFRDGFDNIDFGYQPPNGFKRRGHRVVKTYGPKVRPTIQLFTGILR